MRFCMSVAAAALAAATIGTPASAQFAKPEDAIKYRQSALTLLASHFGRMDGVVKGRTPYDAEEIKQNVALVRTLAQLPWAAFVPGSEGGGSRAQVWSDAPGFNKAKQGFLVAIDELSAAADSADLGKVRAAFGKVGASCKACHDSYRARR